MVPKRLEGIVVALVAAACSTSAGPTTTTVPASRVSCDAFVDTFEPGDAGWYTQQVFDAIILPGVPLDLGRDGEPGTPYEGLRFAKFGLVVRPDRRVTLEITDVDPGIAVMEWGAFREAGWPTTRLEVGPCPGSGGDWIVFAGGLWVSEEPTCVTVAVGVDGRREEVEIGVEAPCA